MNQNIKARQPEPIEIINYVSDQWNVVSNHEQRLIRLEDLLKELKEKLEKKQVHHLGRVHEF